MDSACQASDESRLEKTDPTSTMESLPREILIDILSRIPIASLHNVKLVCRSWRDLAQDPVLVDTHFSRMPENDPCLILHCDYPLQNQLYATYFYAHNESLGVVKKIHVPEMPEFEMVGSSNGWLCLCDSLHKNTFHVCNPFTNDCIELPQTTPCSYQWPVFGFGFHPETKEYKVLRIAQVPRHSRGFPCRINPPYSEVQILTLGSPTWRNLRQTPYLPSPSPSQVLVNGRLHWANWPRRYRPGRMLLSFDLADEQFREVPKPDSADLERRQYDLVVLGGCLATAYYGNYGLLDIWIMKEYGVKESWIKKFVIGTYLPRGLEQSVDHSFNISKFYSYRSINRVICALKNGEVLLEYHCRVLVFYDPKSETFRDIAIQGMPNWFQAVFHVGSLTSIDTLGVI